MGLLNLDYRPEGEIDVGCGLTQSDYLEIMYSDREGFITSAHKAVVDSDSDDDWVEYNFKNNSIADNIYFSNAFTSINTFFIPRRGSNNVKNLNCFYADVDVYTKKLPKKQALSVIQDRIKNKIIPKPTFIVDSGHGLYLIWKIDELVPGTSRSLKFYSQVEKYLFQALEDLGADKACTDAARVLRVPGSYNFKKPEDPKKVKIIEYNPSATYNFINFKNYRITGKKSDKIVELGIFTENAEEKIKYEEERSKKIAKAREEYNANGEKWERENELKRQQKAEQGKVEPVAKVDHIFNMYSLCKARAKDLEKLVELRTGKLTKRRELLLFLYRYYLEITENEEIAFEKTLELNQKFSEPLDTKEIIKSTPAHHAAKAIKKAMADKEYKNWESGENDKAGYCYKTLTLIKIFSITADEQAHMENLISNNEKYIRKQIKRQEEYAKRGLNDRQKAKQELIKKITKLYNKGLNQVEIAKKLNVSKSTVSRYLADVKVVETADKKLHEIVSNIWDSSQCSSLSFPTLYSPEDSPCAGGLQDSSVLPVSLDESSETSDLADLSDDLSDFLASSDDIGVLASKRGFYTLRNQNI